MIDMKWSFSAVRLHSFLLLFATSSWQLGSLISQDGTSDGAYVKDWHQDIRIQAEVCKSRLVIRMYNSSCTEGQVYVCDNKYMVLNGSVKLEFWPHISAEAEAWLSGWWVHSAPIVHPGLWYTDEQNVFTCSPVDTQLITFNSDLHLAAISSTWTCPN